ncbi:MAG: prevent-host-death family protein [Bradymonadia bacterium]|jgi:prevent-host-death family protein
MKPIQTSQNIVPIGEFKTHASRIVRGLARNDRPVVITQNGKAAGVLISPDEFDRLTERERFVAAVERGLSESESGELVEDDDLDALLGDAE